MRPPVNRSLTRAPSPEASLAGARDVNGAARALGILPAKGQLVSVEEIRAALTWKNSRQPALRQAFKQQGGLDVGDILGASALVSVMVMILPAIASAIFFGVGAHLLGAATACVFSLTAFKFARSNELDALAREIFRSQLIGASPATLEQLKSAREFTGQRSTKVALAILMQEAEEAALPSSADILAGRVPLLLEEGLAEGESNHAAPSALALG